MNKNIINEQNIIGDFKLEICFWIMSIWFLSFLNGSLTTINKISILREVTKDDSVFLILNCFINTPTTIILAIIGMFRIWFVISKKFDLKNKYINQKKVEEDYSI